MATVPTMIGWGGIYLLHWGLLSIVLLGQTCGLVGYGNTMLPLLKQKRRKSEQEL